MWQPNSLPMCHRASAGCPAYRVASRSTSRAACSRNTWLDGQNCCRAPAESRVPSARTGRISGYWCDSHGGGEPVIVARQTATSWSASLSITVSNQPKSNSPGRGST